MGLVMVARKWRQRRLLWSAHFNRLSVTHGQFHVLPAWRPLRYHGAFAREIFMLSPDQFLAFLAAAVLITASPGPDNLMVLGVGMSRGRRQGMAFGLGCALGCLTHTVLATIGVSALLAASPTAFTALKVAGGLYLVWLGIGALRSRGGARVDGAAALPDESLLRLFGDRKSVG